jgi:5-methylcytosine-specific restriction protein A
MPSKPKRPCSQPGCPELTDGGKCEQHRKQETQRYDQQRGSAHSRGYTVRWRRYSQWFIRQPENVFCKLQLAGCTNLTGCVDHIQPCEPNDPLWFDPSNHQGSCTHCNSVKGHRYMKGEGQPFEAEMRRES